MDLPPTQKGLSNASGVYAIELMIIVAMVGVIAGFAFLNLVQGNHTNYIDQPARSFQSHQVVSSGAEGYLARRP